jgi:outer membrane protein assembly factor BamD (BamD/ComL family)
MYMKLSERFRAQKTLQQLIVKYPESKQRASAEKLLADLRTEPEPAPSPWK